MINNFIKTTNSAENSEIAGLWPKHFRGGEHNNTKLSAVLLQIHSGTFLVREIRRISLARTSFLQFNLRRGHTSSKR